MAVLREPKPSVQEDEMLRGIRVKMFAAAVAAMFVIPSSTAIVTAATSCESLTGLKIPNATITMAESVSAGGFKMAGSRSDASQFTRLPAFCRVAASLKPSSDSDIKIEVWLPIALWNNKYEAVGNGGWAGTISYPAMATALQQGFATSSTDTGHVGANGSFALGHPEKLVDYAYRSEHEMTVVGKAVISAFYGQAPKLSYFNGCSTGGRQALVEASRFPEDFNGIVAGAAANPKTHLDSWRMWMSQAMLKDKDSYIPPSKYPMIHQAVLAKCDALDGVKDGLIEDPTQCHFDPSALLCQAGDAATCLTVAQVAAAKVIMSPVRSRKTGELIFPGFEPGNELGWGRLLGGPDPYQTAVDQFKYIVFSDPNWDWRTFDLERDVAKADESGAALLSAVDPNLSRFASRGGKLLMYHGWADQDIAPQASVNFYGSTIKATTAPAGEWLRLFMVPGMQHCNGGEGPNTFDMMAAIQPWVEQGKAPVQVIASHSTAGQVDRTRPLCPYPQVARYTGSGSIDDASNFVCRTK
jgi:feruloyl esterase